MFQFTSHEVVMVLVIAALIFGRHRLRKLAGREDEIERLASELQQRTPVYSAETTQGKEAEFIRDRLPNRFPYWLVLAVVLAIGAALWRLSQR